MYAVNSIGFTGQVPGIVTSPGMPVASMPGVGQNYTESSCLVDDGNIIKHAGCRLQVNDDMQALAKTNEAIGAKWVELSENEQAAFDLFVAKAKQFGVKTSAVLSTDPGLDIDDSINLMVYSLLEKMGLADIRAASVTMGDYDMREQRAQYAQGLADHFGLDDLKIGVGADYEIPDEDNGYFKFINPNEEFMGDIRPENTNGYQNLVDALQEAAPKSLTVLAQAGMSDYAKLVEEHPKLFKEKVAKVVIMGGIASEAEEDTELVTAEGYILPSYRPQNNRTDFDAARTLYVETQRMGIPLIVTERGLAYAAVKETGQLFFDMEATQHPVGLHLSEFQKKGPFFFLGSCIQGKAGPRDENWFFKIVTTLDPDDPSDQQKIAEVVQIERDIEGKVTSFEINQEQLRKYLNPLPQYDSLNLLAAIPAAYEMLYSPRLVSAPGKSPVYVIAGSNELKDQDQTGHLLSALSKVALRGPQ